MDDVFYDAARRQIYASCGEGFVSVLRQSGPDHYALISNVPTAPGARTSLFVPEWDRLYVAVPRSGRQPAQIRIYTMQPQ